MSHGVFIRGLADKEAEVWATGTWRHVLLLQPLRGVRGRALERSPHPDRKSVRGFLGLDLRMP